MTCPNGKEKNMSKLTCETCGHYRLYEMITSGRPFGYGGVIPCYTCSRFNPTPDRHTARKGMSGAEQALKEASHESK